jgi:glycosyltransferase involved in cell wall biosynthesis
VLENKGFSPTIISLENVAKLIQKEDGEGKRIIVFPWNFLKNQFFKNSKRINQILSDFNFGIAVGRWFESAYFFYQSSLPYSIWISNSILDNKKAFIESSQFPFKLGTLIYKKVIKYEKKIIQSSKWVWVTSDTSKNNISNLYKDFTKKFRVLRIPYIKKENEFLPDDVKSNRNIIFLGKPDLTVLDFIGFLRVFKNIKSAAGTEDIFLQVLGEKPKSIFFRFALKGMQLEKDIFFNKINKIENIERIFQHSWVYVEPSNFDLVGVGLLKAVSYGIPVLSCFGSISGEVIADGENGLLVPKGDYESLNRALAQLIFNDKVREDCRSSAHKALLEKFTQKSFDVELEQLKNL